MYVEDEHLEERRAEPEGGRDEDQRRATAEADERGGERDQRPGRRDRYVADFVGRPALDDGEDPERERIHARERREGTEEHAQLGLALLDGLHELRSCPRLVEATRSLQNGHFKLTSSRETHHALSRERESSTERPPPASHWSRGGVAVV